MKVPVGWLKEFVEIDLSPSELADRLTFAGLEVEGLETVGAAFEGVVVGEILSLDRHPEADRLWVCRVGDGVGERQVVCGVNNFSVGDKVPLARIGATLPNGQRIVLAKLRGVESQGMLCAEDELGLSDDHAGILILDRELRPGLPLVEAAGAPETVLTLEITPNRPDCLSLMGVAREVAALTGKRWRRPDDRLKETGGDTASLTRVTVEDAEGCPRYTARLVSGLHSTPAPLWMRRRLTCCGVRPINAVVDITNYVMLECGQPLHAFDLDRLEGRCIVVRRGRVGESLLTLDGARRELTPEILVIADASNPVAVAGIMGGEKSGVLPSTGTVLLESACFKPSVVRQGSKRLGLSSESSYRFERGVDIELAEHASRRAAGLMADLAGGQVARGALDVFPVKPETRSIVCRFDRIRQRLGMAVSNERMAGIFESLELIVVQNETASCLVRVPTFRLDLEGEADLAEEVARIHGLERIPSPAPRAERVPGADDTETRAALACRSCLVGLGLSEVMHYSFVSDRLANLFHADGAARRIQLPNPISADHSLLRDTLLPQLVETLGRNRARQISEAAFFEMGRVFFKTSDGQPAEEDRVSVGLMGPVGRSPYNKRTIVKDEEMFLWVKGIVEHLCAALHVAGLTWRPAGPGAGDADFPCGVFESRQWVEVSVDGARCGVLGIVSEALRREWRILEPVGVFEARLKPLLGRVFHTPSAKPLPVYPSVARDVAMILDPRIRHEDVLREIKKISPKELTRVELFDIYQSKGIGMGKRSMAYTLVYRSLDRTLTDEEVNGLHEAVKVGLRNELGAEIREQ
ncbi:MAG: phenylalanine--tRNA ligase subunit beta [Lentisphaerae bacterium]|nr:phenylalanine--tRNA ligase subunit beta [Lentisphaerota bacterium]